MGGKSGLLVEFGANPLGNRVAFPPSCPKIDAFKNCAGAREETGEDAVPISYSFTHGICSFEWLEEHTNKAVENLAKFQ